MSHKLQAVSVFTKQSEQFPLHFFNLPAVTNRIKSEQIIRFRPGAHLSPRVSTLPRRFLGDSVGRDVIVFVNIHGGIHLAVQGASTMFQPQKGQHMEGTCFLVGFTNKYHSRTQAEKQKTSRFDEKPISSGDSKCIVKSVKLVPKSVHG